MENPKINLKDSQIQSIIAIGVTHRLLKQGVNESDEPEVESVKKVDSDNQYFEGMEL